LEPSYLSRKFKHETGINLVDYIKQIRLEKGLYLLLATNKSVGEIASNIGFNSLSDFDRCFKKKYRLSANEYCKVKKGKKKDDRCLVSDSEKRYDYLTDEVCRRISMVLNVEDDLIFPLVKYCKGNGINLEKLLGEIIIGEQVKNCIDQNGQKYKETKIEDIRIDEGTEILNELGIDNIINTQKMKLGKLYEEVRGGEVLYILGNYKNYGIVIITRNKSLGIIKKLENTIIETNQIYAWVSTYNTPIIKIDIRGGEIAIYKKIS
jgi:AraC-like DNA-binding protein